MHGENLKLNVEVKVKVKVTLQQPRKAQMGSKVSSSILFL